MSDPESPKKRSDKVIKAVTPGQVPGRSVTPPSARSEKKIVLNRSSGKLSQRIALEREQAKLSGDEDAPGSLSETASLGFAKIFVIALLGLVLVGGLIIFLVTRNPDKPSTPAATATAVKLRPTPEAAPKPRPTGPLGKGLIGHWSLDGDLKDSAGKHRPGETKNPPVFIAGRHGQALSLKGDDPVFIPEVSQELHELRDHFSICIWVKTPEDVKQNTTWPTLVGRGNASFIVCLTKEDRQEFHAAFTISGNPDRLSMNTRNHAFPLDTWHHVAFIRDGDAAYVYVDGAIAASTREVTAKADLSKELPLCIGGNPTHHMKPVDNRSFIGALDDLRIYKRALSFDEVNKLVKRP